MLYIDKSSILYKIMQGGIDVIAVLVVFIAIIYLVLDVVISQKFESIAEEKGHSGYFAWCFFRGAVGWAMVIALPDRKNVSSNNSSQANSATEQPQSYDDRLPEL